MSEEVVQDTTETTEETSLEEALYGENQQEESDANESQDDKEEQPEESMEDKSEDSDESKDEGEEEGDTDEYEFDVPEGISDAQVEELAAYAEEHGLSNEAAQKLLDKQAESINSFKEDAVKQHEEMVNEWNRELKNDPYFGGEDFAKNAEMTKRVIDKFGDEALKADLESTGYGSHPGLVKMLHRIGKSMGDGSLIKGKTEVVKEKPLEDYFYPKKD